MTQDRLLQMVISVMISGGYLVSERFSMRPRSFDLIASNGKVTLAIKVVSHIDSVSEETASDLELVARHLKGSAIIIGERARDAELERGAVYLRYGIYAICVSTLYDYVVEGIPPLIYASPGGLYVAINGEALREQRERRSMSLGDLGHLLGVSRRTISKYESGMGTTLEVAQKIEELFDSGLVQSIDLLHPHGESKERVEYPEGEVPMSFLEQTARGNS